MPLLVALLMGIYQAVNIAFSDLEFSRVNTELSFWGRQGYKPAASRVSNVGATINTALQRWPGNPQYLQAQGRYCCGGRTGKAVQKRQQVSVNKPSTPGCKP